jgi:hypothetical protein
MQHPRDAGQPAHFAPIAGSLRTGDSLFGEFISPVEHDLHQRFGLVMNQAILSARRAAAGMGLVESLTDADIGEVKSSADAFAGVEDATEGLRSFLDIFHASRWLPPKNLADEIGREALFGGSYGDPVQIAAGETPNAPKEDATYLRRRGRKVKSSEAHAATVEFIRAARRLAADRHFLHWEAAFPGVWDDWESHQPPGKAEGQSRWRSAPGSSAPAAASSSPTP